MSVATESPSQDIEEGAPTRSPLIDTDVHEHLPTPEDLHPYLPKQFWSGIKRELPSSPYALPGPAGARKDWISADGSYAVSRELLGEHLFDGEKVTTAILTGSTYPSLQRTSIEAAQAFAHAYNDWQVEHWLEWDPRLRGSVHVVAHDPQVAAKEIDRVAEHPRIVQVHLPLVADRQYGDPFYRPIYEAAVRNGLPVALHHSGLTPTLLGFPRYYIEWHTVVAPHAGQNQLLSIIVNGTFEKLPELKVVLLETGVTWLPWFIWRLDQQYRELRSEVPWVKRLPSEWIRDNVRLSTQPLNDVSPKQFKQLVELVDTERVFMFSTDYPHYDADSVDRTVPGSLGDLSARVRWRNALETYPRLKADEVGP